MMFHCCNYNIVLFLNYIKNEIEILQVFINMCDYYYILLYISIDLLIYNYIFYSL
jgi:hypothetical protein